MVVPLRDASGDDASLGVVFDFLRLLWAVDHSLQSASKRMLRDLGVTGLQRMTVRFVGRFDAISAQELATLLHVDPSTLTGVLDKLVRAGAVRRRKDPADARRAQISLTDKGKAIDGLRKGTVEDAVRKALDRSSPREIAAASAILQRIVDELG